MTIDPTKPLNPRDSNGIAKVSTEGQVIRSSGPEWHQRSVKFEHETSGSPVMEVNGKPGGTEYIIWNGTGAGDTGGDWTQGGTRDSAVETTEADRGFGTNGLDVQTAKNKYQNFVNGSTITPESYVTLVIWLNTQTYPTGGDIVANWRLAGDQKGSWCYLDNYIDEFTPGVWKKVEIPITDFGLDPGQTVDELRLNFLTKSGFDMWFDDIHLDEAGGSGPQTFQVGPEAVEGEPDEAWHVDKLTILCVSGDTGWNASTLFNLSSAPESGLLLRLVDDVDGVLWTLNFLDNTDLWGHFMGQEPIDYADATRQVVWDMITRLGRIDLSNTRRLELVVRDDLSPLTKLRAFCDYGREVLS